MSDDNNTNEEVVENTDAGLKAKNKELLNKLAKANKDRENLEARLAALEDAAEEAKGTSTELSKAQKAQKAAETELARITALYEAQGGKLKSAVLYNEIDKAMDEAKVLPHMRKPMRALFLSEVEWDAEEGQGSIGGKSVSEHVSSYFKSKAAAHYVAAPVTGGADAEGNTNTQTADKWSDLSKVGAEHGNLTDYLREAVKNRDVFNARATEQGRTDLLV